MSKLYKIVGNNILFNCGYEWDSCANSPCPHSSSHGCQHPDHEKYVEFMKSEEAKNLVKELGKHE